VVLSIVDAVTIKVAERIHKQQPDSFLVEQVPRIMRGKNKKFFQQFMSKRLAGYLECTSWPSSSC